MKTRLTLTVGGAAVPQGSKKAVPQGKRWGVVDIAEGRLKPWRDSIATLAQAKFQGPMIEGPVRLRLVFVRVRAASHFTSKGWLSAAGAAVRQRLAPCSEPDLNKTGRAVEDALTGIVYRDDSQIVWSEYRKVWGTSERVLIVVEEIDDADPANSSLYSWLDILEKVEANPATVEQARQRALEEGAPDLMAALKASFRTDGDPNDVDGDLAVDPRAT